MSSIFISYSRKNKDFAEKLFQSLSEKEYDTWVDWQGIPLTADWLDEIYRAIDKSDAFIFIISPSSVASEVCTKEIEYATSKNKRIVPLLYKKINPIDAHLTIQQLNWIFFDKAKDYQRSISQLSKSLEQDLDHCRLHTRLLVRAEEWQHKKSNSSLLLRGIDLKEAEVWLNRAKNKEPRPTQLHQNYILKSSNQEKKKRRLLFTSITSVFLLTLGLLIKIYFDNKALTQALIDIKTKNRVISNKNEKIEEQNIDIEIKRQIAVYERNRAETERTLAISKQLAAEALLKQGQSPVKSLILSAAAIKLPWQSEKLRVQAAEDALAKALNDPFLGKPLYLGKNANIKQSAYASQAKLLITLDYKGNLALIDLKKSKPTIRTFKPNIEVRQFELVHINGKTFIGAFNEFTEQLYLYQVDAKKINLIKKLKTVKLFKLNKNTSFLLRRNQIEILKLDQGPPQLKPRLNCNKGFLSADDSYVIENKIFLRFTDGQVLISSKNNCIQLPKKATLAASSESHFIFSDKANQVYAHDRKNTTQLVYKAKSPLKILTTSGPWLLALTNKGHLQLFKLKEKKYKRHVLPSAITSATFKKVTSIALNFPWVALNQQNNSLRIMRLDGRKVNRSLLAQNGFTPQPTFLSKSRIAIFNLDQSARIINLKRNSNRIRFALPVRQAKDRFAEVAFLNEHLIAFSNFGNLTTIQLGLGSFATKSIKNKIHGIVTAQAQGDGAIFIATDQKKFYRISKHDSNIKVKQLKLTRDATFSSLGTITRLTYDSKNHRLIALSSSFSKSFVFILRLKNNLISKVDYEYDDVKYIGRGVTMLLERNVDRIDLLNNHQKKSVKLQYKLTAWAKLNGQNVVLGGSNGQINRLNVRSLNQQRLYKQKATIRHLSSSPATRSFASITSQGHITLHRIVGQTIVHDNSIRYKAAPVIKAILDKSFLSVQTLAGKNYFWPIVNGRITSTPIEKHFEPDSNTRWYMSTNSNYTVVLKPKYLSFEPIKVDNRLRFACQYINRSVSQAEFSNLIGFKTPETLCL